MSGKAFSVFIAVVLLAGCVTTADDLEWPEGAYPRSYFEAAFEEDEAAREYQTRDEYLLWVTRFYNGYRIAPGWLNLTAQVMSRLEPEGAQRQSEVRERLYQLGARIGSEWAKDNAVRLLDTRNAAIWRDALIESINQDDLDNYITRVENDVDSMLAGELGREDIYFERYYVDDFEF